MYRPKIVPDTFSHSDCQLSNCINSMRLSYPELTWFHGFFFEFNSLGEYLEFLLGRLVGAIIGFRDTGTDGIFPLFIWTGLI